MNPLLRVTGPADAGVLSDKGTGVAEILGNANRAGIPTGMGIGSAAIAPDTVRVVLVKLCKSAPATRLAPVVLGTSGAKWYCWLG